MNNENFITVVGSGYVGMSIGVLLAQNNIVTIFDIDKSKIDKVNKKISPIDDTHIKSFLNEKDINITGTTSKDKAYKQADFVVIAISTNYDPIKKSFNTVSIDHVIEDAVSRNKKVSIILKSTIPIGYSEFLSQKYKNNKIIFAPEFLQEGRALFDNLYPSRIVVGSKCEEAKKFVNLLVEGAKSKDIPIIYTNPKEAESIKLFSNAYLAMRIAFFNELDSYGITKNLDVESIIKGVCLDPRIGDGYNNPSFGYGGYCLPKDTKQLLNDFENTPEALISSVVESNKIRKNFITNEILKRNPKVIGIYRLVSKKNSDNFRSSAIEGIIKRLIKHNLNIIIYEPKLEAKNYLGFKKINDLNNFKNMSDLILVNRKDDLINDVNEKCFSRDIFGYN